LFVYSSIVFVICGLVKASATAQSPTIFQLKFIIVTQDSVLTSSTFKSDLYKEFCKLFSPYSKSFISNKDSRAFFILSSVLSTDKSKFSCTGTK
jgi:hypothetical protein